MYFTQEDYRKIEQWLQRRAIKDTDFQEAQPLNGEETVTLVQDEHNKKMFVKDLVDQIFKLGVSDFLNVTDKYKACNISLCEAVRLIPCKARKAGQVITFLNTEGNWEIYQFKGVLNQWNHLDLWENLFDWEKLIINSILPDEEDLTKSPADENGNSYLSLKDREYNPEDFSGLGRVILRKNIIREVEHPGFGSVNKNVLYQDMISKPNTVYEIRYDFDLNGETITIPENCVLKFEGGSLKNGSITLNNTIIESFKCAFTNITFYNTTDFIADLNWFIPDNATDISDVLNSVLPNFTKAVFNNAKTFELSKPIVFNNYCYFECNTNLIYVGSSVNISVITFNNCSRAYIKILGHLTSSAESSVDTINDNTNVIGYNFINYNNSTIYIASVSYFNESVRLSGIGYGCANNTVRIGISMNSNRHIRIYQNNNSNNAIGWANENRFYDCHLAVTSDWKRKGGKSTAIYIKGGDSDSYNKVNSLLFFKMCVEDFGKMNGYTIYANNVTNSSFIHCRNENGDNFVKFVGNCYNNNISPVTFGSSITDYSECRYYPINFEYKMLLGQFVRKNIINNITNDIIANSIFGYFKPDNNTFSASYTRDSLIGVIINLEYNRSFIIESTVASRFFVKYLTDINDSEIVDQESFESPKINIENQFSYFGGKYWYITGVDVYTCLINIPKNVKKVFIGCKNNIEQFNISAVIETNNSDIGASLVYLTEFIGMNTDGTLTSKVTII